MNDDQSQDKPSVPNRKRRTALAAVAGAAIIGATAYGAYRVLVLNHYESTDNAYVQGNIVQITPQVSGTVQAIHVSETDSVKAGQPLIELDPTDARVAVEQAQAQLAQTVREVRTVFATNATLKAQIAARDADLARARAELARAQDDVRRRQPLLATGAVGKEEFEHASAQQEAARSAVAAAQSAVLAAREQLTVNQSLTEGTDVERHPNVLRAAAQLREAHLALHRDGLAAPVDGYVAKRNVQLGQRVQAGAPLMTVVGLQDVWVDANFKEAQLRRLRIGQPVTLTADAYGDKVEYHGTVQGLGAGTGSAFSLLPAQNATGNWIKVVQRVPVRIALDPKELTQHPLRVGLSMEVKVDVSGPGDGRALGDRPTAQAVQPASAALPSSGDDEVVEAEVRRIIAENLGRAPRAEGPLAAGIRPQSAVRPAHADATKQLASLDAGLPAAR